MKYAIKINGSRSQKAGFLVTYNNKWYIGSEKDAVLFDKNHEAVEAAGELVKDIAMFGIPAPSFALTMLQEPDLAKPDKK